MLDMPVFLGCVWKFVTLKVQFLEGGFYLFAREGFPPVPGADKYFAHPLTCMWSWWKSLVFCPHRHIHGKRGLAICTSWLWNLSPEQQWAVSVLWTVPPQRTAECSNPRLSPHPKVWLGTPRPSPTLRFATCRLWCVRVCVCLYVCVCAQMSPLSHPALPPHSHFIHPEPFYLYGNLGSTAGIPQSTVIY